MKKLFMIIMLLYTKLTFAAFCADNDWGCIIHYREETERLYNTPVQQQQYNNYNSGGTVYVKPDAWGAVVYNSTRAQMATSGGEVSEEEAIKAAQQKCGSDCKAEFIYKNSYVAVVEGKLPEERGYRLFFWDAPTEYAAKRRAFKECAKQTKECVLVETNKSFF